jgi:hypothetical protein
MKNRKADLWGAEDQFASVSDGLREYDLKFSSERFLELVHELVGFEPLGLIIPSHSKDEAFARFIPILGISGGMFEEFSRGIMAVAKSRKVRFALMNGILLGQMAVMMALSDAVRSRAKKRKDGADAERRRDRTSESFRRTACEFVDGHYSEYLKSHARGFEKFWQLEQEHIYESLEGSGANGAREAAASLRCNSRLKNFVKAKVMQTRIRDYRRTKESAR